MEVSSRMTAEEIGEFLREFVTAFGQGGNSGEAFAAVDTVEMTGANALLSQIWQAFIEKSRGGVGSDGIKWKPLAKSTIAQRRTTAGERTKLGIGGKRVRGLLTPAEDQKWRKIFCKVYAQYRVRMGEKEAMGIAAAVAWKTLKADGAKTKLDVLGNRQVDILRDTGELLRSLQPGVDAQPSGNDGQIIRVGEGRITVGSNKKPWHHRGNPPRLPSRPLWPLDGKVPEVWMDAILEAMTAAIGKTIGAGVA